MEQRHLHPIKPHPHLFNHHCKCENTPADGDLIVNAASANDIVDLAGNAVTSFTDESFETLVSQKTVVDTTPPLAPADLDLHNDSDTCADFDGTTGCDFGANMTTSPRTTRW